jgi:hypothetical protein
VIVTDVDGRDVSTTVRGDGGAVKAVVRGEGEVCDCARLGVEVLDG